MLVAYGMLKRKVAMSYRMEGNIYLCDDIDAPFILGIITPGIYIPSSLTETDLVYVLRHEQVHLRRYGICL